MTPGGVLAWLPVVEQIVDGITCLIQRGRARRARRRKQREALKRMGLTK